MSRQKWLTRSPEFSRQYAKLSGKDKAVIRSSGLLMPSILTSNQCGQVFDFLERPRTRAPPQVLVFVFSGKPVRFSRRRPPKAPAACRLPSRAFGFRLARRGLRCLGRRSGGKSRPASRRFRGEGPQSLADAVAVLLFAARARVGWVYVNGFM